MNLILNLTLINFSFLENKVNKSLTIEPFRIEGLPSAQKAREHVL